METGELLRGVYSAADAHAVAILVASILVPILGTLAARVGKGGRTDRDGRLIASAFVGFALTIGAAALLAFTVAWMAFDQTILDANVLLVLAPILCVVGSLVGIRRVFPLRELGSVRTAGEIAAFIGACVAVVWLFSMFRGWGVVFFGGIFQLVIILALGGLLVRRLYRRAFRGRDPGE